MKINCWMILVSLMIWSGAGLSEDLKPGILEQEPASDKILNDNPPSYGATPESMIPYRKSQSPYRYLYAKVPAYRGSREGSPDLSTLQSVPIGVFAPLESDLGKQLIQGVRLAMDEANAAGGFNGIPFEMVLKNDNLLWGSAANTLVDFVEKDKVWAVIGSTDSTSTHVALRAALKLEVPIINVGGVDPTLTETGIPWIIRLSIDDRQNSYRLATLLFEELDLRRVAILRSSDRDGRFGIREFRDAARRLGKPVPMELQFVPGKEDLSPQLERLKHGEVEAVALWANPEDGARILRLFREQNLKLLTVGTERMLSPRLLELAGKAAEGLILTSSMDINRQDDPWLRFCEKYRKRFGAKPAGLSARGYDAATFVVEAIRKVGLQRARIQDYLAAIRKREGLSGTILLDETSNNIAKPLLFQVRGGRFVPYH